MPRFQGIPVQTEAQQGGRFGGVPVEQPEEQPESMGLQQASVIPQPPTNPGSGGGGGEDSTGNTMAFIEPAATIASGAAAEIASGLNALGQLPFNDPAEVEKNMNAVRDFMTFVPRTDEGKEGIKKIAEFVEPLAKKLKEAEQSTGSVGLAAGGPVAGAVTATIPAMALELTGLGPARRAAKAGNTAEKVTRKIEDVDVNERLEGVSANDKGEPLGFVEESLSEKTSKNKRTITETSEETTHITRESESAKLHEKIVENLNNKKTDKIVIDALPNKETLKAADDLGIDLNPDHYSNSREFIETMQALKSRPGSKLGAKEAKAIDDLGERADELITDLGGETDKSVIDADVRGRFNNIIARLENKSNKAYADVGAVIPRSARVNANNSRNYLTKTIDDLGGEDSLLTPAEKRMKIIIEKEPTYAALDRLRKDVGQGFRKQGPYKDEDQGTLRQVYKALSEDQQGAANAFGVGEQYKRARNLVSKRKGIEDASVKLFGREVNNSIVPKITGAATALTKGDVSKFNQLMVALPANKRADAAATMLNDLFTQGAKTKGQLSSGFVKSFEALNRNKGAKDALFRYLPPEARERFDKIGRVAVGIFKAKGLENTSRTARDLLAALDEGGLLNKMYNTGNKVASKVPGGGATRDVVSVIVSKKTTRTEIIDDFVTSTEFKRAVVTAAKTDNPNVADKILKSSRKYKDWKSSLSKEDAALIASQGFIAWFVAHSNKSQ